MKEPDELKEIADELFELLEAYNIEGFEPREHRKILQDTETFLYDKS